MSAINQRVSQLNEMTAIEVASNDLFYIIDTSAHQSKNIRASELVTYLSISGSLLVLHAIMADTASFILGSNVSGSVLSASFANKSHLSDSASFSQFALSASNAITAAFAQNVITNFSVVSASWASSSLSSSLAQVAKFLFYNGTNNGTASFAISASSVNHAHLADTASFLTGLSQISSSFALSSSYSDNAGTASFLQFTPGFVNGTASYALAAGVVFAALQDFGVFLANTQSSFRAQLDTVTINPPASTSIEAVGTVILPFTASIAVNEFINLVVKDRNTGAETVIDSTPIYYYVGATMGLWGSYESGTLKIPYTLLGMPNLISSSYQVFVTASSPVISLEPTRTTRFNLASYSNTLASNVDLPLIFTVAPSQSLVKFSSSLGGPFTDIYPNIDNITGSANILNVDVSNLNLTSVKYVWALPNLLTFNASLNSASLTDIGTMPNKLTRLECYSSSLFSLADLSSTTCSYLNCNSNMMSSLPILPVSMSYLECSNNVIVTLPTSLPLGLTTFLCDTTAIITTPTFPNSITSMSLANNSQLFSFATPLPQSLVYINVSFSPVGMLTSLPTHSLYIIANSSSLTTTAMDNMASQSVSNSLNSGTLAMRGNGMPLASTIATYITTLGGRAWNVTYDGT